MKSFGWILMLLTLASPAWAANKITVQQLNDLLVSLQQARKTDAEVADALKQIELTEELTQGAMKNVAALLPGPLTAAQLYVLEARSAMLPPPASDLPPSPALDVVAQSALLDKAIRYATTTYAQLPHLTATKTTSRFQDNLKPPGLPDFNRSPTDSWSNPRLAAAGQFIDFIGTTEMQVESQNGAGIPSKVKDKTPWGPNGQIALLGQGPVLGDIVQEAQATGKFTWLRWETVRGWRTAVFSFAVNKNSSHYEVNYCCFIPAQQVLVEDSALNSWTPYKETVPFHGEIFVEPVSGIIVRLVTFADLKASDLVHQEDTRIDYGPVKVDGKLLVLPVRTIIDTEINPNGADGHYANATRRTLFILEYNGYESTASAH